MNFPFNIRALRLAITAACLLAPLPGHAMSSIATAVVTLTADGQPCFSVPAGFITIFGIPFHGISVGREDPDSPANDTVHWSMTMQAPRHGATISSRRCYRYGALPPGAVQTPAIPLQPFTAYRVSIDASPGNSGLRGYSAVFCMTRDARGKPQVHEVSRARSDGPQRFDVCRR